MIKGVECIILDRDNVISECKVGEYILNKSQLKIKEGVLEAFKILKSFNIPIYLATKQRCISKNLTTLQEVEEINREIENRIDFKFKGIYIEQEKLLKTDIIKKIIVAAKVNPNTVYYVDDCNKQCSAAWFLGCNVFCSSNLLEVVKKWEIKLKFL